MKANRRNTKKQFKELSLRPIERKDLRLLRKWKNDSTARRSVGDGTRTFSEEDMERWFERTEALIDRDRRWIVVEGGRPVGFVGLYGIDLTRRHAEIGILLDSGARGRGIGREATWLVFDEAFNMLNLHRLYLHVLSDHRIAQKMYKRCGFRDEGRLRQHNFKAGRYVDVIVMGILASEHAAQHREEGRKRSPR
ncbi:MAG: GNAT family protein [Deltaproteobacteria bacterium]|nr:GNAT family protein [Deltaproteobacteria bacterium]